MLAMVEVTTVVTEVTVVDDGGGEPAKYVCMYVLFMFWPSNIMFFFCFHQGM